ncbi:MAG: T9SS type A sorting domain-containing protein, partial [Bacteroidetes bacterium]|nr:T9SS type A sorting domain-containing protein [Bacteroidota bacterium]
RFDFILLSEKFFDDEDLWYVAGSYTAIGNDASHFNLAINQGTNGAVPAGIPDALHAASDHLPVMLKLAYPTELAIGLKDGGRLPKEYSLEHNYPNPWNAQTTISYSLPTQSSISLIIYNISGQEIMGEDEQDTPSGYHQKTWNGTNNFGVPVGSGVYLYRLIASDFAETKKMIFLK